MRKRLLTAAAAAVALVTAPVAAQSSLAQSNLVQRAPAAIADSENFAPSLILVFVAVAAVATGMLVIANDDQPTSP